MSFCFALWCRSKELEAGVCKKNIRPRVKDLVPNDAAVDCSAKKTQIWQSPKRSPTPSDGEGDDSSRSLGVEETIDVVAGGDTTTKVSQDAASSQVALTLHLLRVVVV